MSDEKQPLDLARYRACSDLLEPPAGDVVRTLCDECERLRAERDEAVAERVRKVLEGGILQAKLKACEAELGETVRDADLAIECLACSIEEHGITHDDGCPEDDTCECEIRSRFAWLTTERVERAAAANRRRKERGR